MTHRGPFQPLLFGDSVKRLLDHGYKSSHGVKVFDLKFFLS